MDKSEAISTVDDAIRKLVQLSSKEKVWAQEVLLQVNDKSLRLLDVESQVPAGNSRCREFMGIGRTGCPTHLDVRVHAGLWKGMELRVGRGENGSSGESGILLAT